LKFRIVCATRESADSFGTATALGRSLALYPFPFVELRLFPRNSAGLPAIYNAAINEPTSEPTIVVFVHDDVHLTDIYWPDRLKQGLAAFDIIGIAGNTRRLPGQPSWKFLDTRFTPDTAQYLSGAIAHGQGWPPERISYYGTIGREVKLLDGVLLVARIESLLSCNVLFDERFDFHFYDLDFCRQAEQRGLRMGTWPVPIIHESGGDLHHSAWKDAYSRYIDKWGS
jgi:GT2 family glycosyltransferase